jgi:uncharacterized lipoprotein YddW (UPF0748 family)
LDEKCVDNTHVPGFSLRTLSARFRSIISADVFHLPFWSLFRDLTWPDVSMFRRCTPHRLEGPHLWRAVILLIACTALQLDAQEFRAFWADAFHAGFKNGTEISQLIADLRAANCNAAVVEVRKRGDAYYNSLFEPKATDISPGFDPLADLIAKAHNTAAGARIEIHAWIVTYPIWGSQSTAPSQSSHPYNLHPDWLNQDNTGATWDGSAYTFDPGHPAVQKHTFNVALDIISRYDIDGLNFDYARYAGNTWGYNAAAVQRFNQKYARTGRPSPTDSTWLQFRRDQVTALVRKVYLSAIALKPAIKISADTICFAPGITADSQWTSTSAYSSVLQDWRAWMQEGILDLNIPMQYFNQFTRASDWANWSTFTKNHRYNRHLAIGPGIYLNSVSNALYQMRSTRTATASGFRSDGVVGYSYAVPSSNNVSRATFLAALTQTNTAALYDPNPSPLFSNRVVPPAMPWKTAPTRGYLKGFVRNASSDLEAATVALSGPTNRTLASDATGFYGAVDLPTGNYTLTASFSGLAPVTTNFVVAAGLVTTRDFILAPYVPPQFESVRQSADNQIKLSLNGESGVHEWLEATADFIHWLPIGEMIYTNGVFEFIDASLTNIDRRFYRVRVAP